MALTPGTRLGPYEIQSAIGAGGMGEVYQALDTRLDRIVAVKVSQEQFSERFEREARAISALNHPHICQLYDVGPNYLVMEYVEGAPLAGPLALDQALKYGAQICAALEAAHRKGIVHRDLKPDNILLTKAGVKLLDFGLAKQAAGGSGVTDADAARTKALTGAHVIVGTPQYMAPEQIESRDADARTDIFAFGCVLYELLTGQKAFDGRTASATMAAILATEPRPMRELQPITPSSVERIVTRCLAKDPDDRWQTARDLRAEIEWAATGGRAADAPAASPTASSWTSVIWKTAAALVGMIAIGFLASYSGRHTESPTARFFVYPPEKTTFDTTGYVKSSAISPDGRVLAFTARNMAGNVSLWLRPIDSLTAVPLAGTDGASQPFWSPDSRFIGYFSTGKLLRIAAMSGAPQAISDVLSGINASGAWNSDGTILYSSGRNGGVVNKVSSTGGVPSAITKIAAGAPSYHRSPSFLPDARHYLFYVSPGAQSQRSGIYLASIDSDDVKWLLDSDSGAVYAPPGYLLFARQGTLFAQPFNAKTFALGAETMAITDRVSVPNAGATTFSASANGTIAYDTGAVSSTELHIVRLDRTGKVIDTIGPPGNYMGIDVAPDGKRIAVHRHDGQGGDIWLAEPGRANLSRFTFDPTQDNSAPVWSPDGSEIAFASQRAGKWGLYRKPSNGASTEELLLEPGLQTIPTGWTPDGRALLYVVYDTKTAGDVWRLPLTGDRKPVPVLNSAFSELHNEVSPDGKWLAYASGEQGFGSIYVGSLSSTAGKWQVSTSLGAQPRWRRDGRELFYFVPQTDNGSKLMVVDVRTNGSVLEATGLRELFNMGRFPGPHSSGGNYWSYAVSADGQQFVAARRTDDGAQTESPIVVVLNWAAALKK